MIFCGNHANQFIDPCMIIAYCMQDVAFLVAKKSMSLPIVGSFAKKMKCVPVERPQDLARKGTGKVKIVSVT